MEALASFIFAEAALQTRKYADLDDVGGRALGLARAIDDQEAMALVLSRLGMGSVGKRQFAEASRHLREALEHATTLGFPGIGAVCCYGLAAVSVDWGQPVRAARLLGAAEALRRASGSLLLPSEAVARDDAFAAIRQALSDEAIRIAMNDGSRPRMERALADAAGLSLEATQAGVTVL